MDSRILKENHTQKMNSEETVNAYADKMTGIVNILSEVGHIIPEGDQKRFLFLNILFSEFETVSHVTSRTK